MVVLKKVKKGADPTVARTKSNSRGRWDIHKARAHGRYYSIAKSKTVITLVGLIIQCLPDRSNVLRV
jgi:hypothetical protein